MTILYHISYSSHCSILIPPGCFIPWSLEVLLTQNLVVRVIKEASTLLFVLDIIYETATEMFYTYRLPTTASFSGLSKPACSNVPAISAASICKKTGDSSVNILFKYDSMYSHGLVWFVGVLTSLCHSNGHIETMPAREINPFTALTRIRSQFLRTQ